MIAGGKYIFGPSYSSWMKGAVTSATIFFSMSVLVQNTCTSSFVGRTEDTALAPGCVIDPAVETKVSSVESCHQHRRHITCSIQITGTSGKVYWTGLKPQSTSRSFKFSPKIYFCRGFLLSLCEKHWGQSTLQYLSSYSTHIFPPRPPSFSIYFKQVSIASYALKNDLTSIFLYIFCSVLFSPNVWTE